MLAGYSSTIFQGEYGVSNEPDLYFTTVLGSCVAACIRDPHNRIGGMNHFLLPGLSDISLTAQQYGVHLMELLVNGLLKKGATKKQLEAKLFGGARVIHGLSDIGKHNADFAEHFLNNEGIKIIGSSLGGRHPRKIHFWPVSGRARQLLLPIQDMPVAKPTSSNVFANSGNLELF